MSTFRAPTCSAIAADIMPIGPAPVINTSSPTKSKDNVACTAFPNGSKILPTSLLTDSGNATTFEAGIIRYSANAPSLSTPKFTVSGSRCNLPALAFLLLDPAICPSADTLMPTLRFSTFSPISSISPINSWPTVIGILIVLLAQVSQFQICRSVPQIAVDLIFIKTSWVLIVGFSTSLRVKPMPSISLTNAFI